MPDPSNANAPCDEPEDAYEAHDAGFVDPEIEEVEAVSEGCSGCGATKRDDGWTWHPSDCPMVALSAEGKRVVDEKVASVAEARRHAMEGASTYVIG